MPDFGAKIADAQVNLEKDGFKPLLWTPEWDIPVGEEEAFTAPHDPQMLAALQVFAWLFVSSVQRVWVHLAAEMQAGKTGVIAAVARLVLANARRLKFAPNRIFVVTGMSDDAWQKQTAPRLPGVLRENVHHGATLSQVAEKLARLAGDGVLANVLIFIDESHYATSSTNQPARFVYEAVARICPREQWTANNIRFVTISATDPAKVLTMKSSDTPCQVVRLHTTDAYQSVEKLETTGRIRFLEQFPKNGALHTSTGLQAMAEAVTELESVHGPLVHILRPNNGKGADVCKSIREQFPEAIIHQWDVAANKEKARKVKEDGSSGVGSATDINVALLNDKPEATTFVLLKGMFRAAKTLNDEHVGVLYDRVGAADATNLQSLLGRACGYGKSIRSIIFASKSTVVNYLSLWRELCASKAFPTEGDSERFAGLKGRMPGVTSVTDGESSRLVPTPGHATPLGPGIGGQTPDEQAASARSKHNDDDYEVTWSEEFTSVDELKAAKLTAGRMPEVASSGFYKNANGGSTPMSRAQLMALKAGKKTTNMRVQLKVGGSTRRTYPFYEIASDPSTVRFVVRTLLRVS